MFPETFTAKLGESRDVRDLVSPTNSVSELYGNGFDLCGPISYTVLSSDGSPQSSQSAFTLQVLTANEVTISVNSAPEDGPILTEQLIIEMTMTEVDGFESV